MQKYIIDCFFISPILEFLNVKNFCIKKLIKTESINAKTEDTKALPIRYKKNEKINIFEANATPPEIKNLKTSRLFMYL